MSVSVSVCWGGGGVVNECVSLCVLRACVCVCVCVCVCTCVESTRSPIQKKKSTRRRQHRYNTGTRSACHAMDGHTISNKFKHHNSIAHTHVATALVKYIIHYTLIRTEDDSIIILLQGTCTLPAPQNYFMAYSHMLCVLSHHE